MGGDHISGVMTAEVLSQIGQAEAFKQEGNNRFKEQNFRGALGSYHKVFCFVNGLQLPGERNEAAQYAEMMAVTLAMLLRSTAVVANILAVEACNGHGSFCMLPFNKFTFPGTHNSGSFSLNIPEIIQEWPPSMAGEDLQEI
eukprot:s1404_g14.t1